MRARQLMATAPTVSPDTAMPDALRTMIESDLPGLVVRLEDGYVVVPASQVLRVALPAYVLADPSLGRVWDEGSADELASRVGGMSVRDLLVALRDERRATTVDPDATTIEIAAVLSAAHVPLVAVVEAGRLVGVVSVNRLVQALLG